ncbi:MAG: hypothetical protein OIF55_08365 [Amphritea sp.]|nr:hypothetical protein [Amphritea sp.]
MEVVFLLIYLALYWTVRLNQTLIPQDAMLHDERLGLLVLMSLIAIPVVLIRVIIGNRYYRKKFGGVYPSINANYLLKHDIAYSAFCMVVLGIIYFSERDYFDESFGELGVSMFIFWFISILFGFLRRLPAIKSGI